ncbi:hypothetical protein HK103_002187 [Boothiomyces macroporosus]|uniref:SH3 domain-containing protein n=1 Tax=Boothiomyces macroporosus TaxID=261099 RepID=A0AAD5U9Y2_9FUNG|nr:hypothetical protein HK103_002187 [Boothiomyces macroporosus]
MILLLANSALSKCISIASTSVCNPYQNSMIDTYKIARAYGIPESQVTAEKWESLVKQPPPVKEWLGCTTNGEAIQYYQTYMCLTDIFLMSSECNNKQPAPVCNQVCKDYGDALARLLKSPTCTYPTPLQARNRKNALNAEQLCMEFSSNQQGTCISGTTLDQQSCGFGGDKTTATVFCANNPQASCCVKKGFSKAMFTDHGYVAEQMRYDSNLNFAQRAANYLSALDVDIPKKKGSESTGFFNSIGFVILCSFIGVFVFAGGMYVVLYQRRVNEPGAAPAPQPPVKTGKRYIAKFDYNALRPDELNIKVGDFIDVLHEHDDKWVEVRNITTLEEGKVFKDHIEELK